MNNNIDTQFRAVAQFIEHETGFPQARVQASTTLLADVGLDGEDAEKFFLAFGKHFGVALAKLNLSRHFGGEGFIGGAAVALPLKLAQSMLGKGIHEQSGLKPICVEQLVQAVKSKSWADR